MVMVVMVVLVVIKRRIVVMRSWRKVTTITIGRVIVILATS